MNIFIFTFICSHFWFFMLHVVAYYLNVDCPKHLHRFSWLKFDTKRSPTSPILNERALSPMENLDDLNIETMHQQKHTGLDMTDYTMKHENDNHILIKTVSSHKNNHDDPGRDNIETTFDLDGNVETKSVGSAKSAGSNQESR